MSPRSTMDYWSIVQQAQNCYQHRRVDNQKYNTKQLVHRFYHHPPRPYPAPQHDISPSTFEIRKKIHRRHAEIVADFYRDLMELDTARHVHRVNNLARDFHSLVEREFRNLTALLEELGNNVLVPLVRDEKNKEMEAVLEEEFPGLIETMALFLRCYGLEEHAEEWLSQRPHIKGTRVLKLQKQLKHHQKTTKRKQLEQEEMWRAIEQYCKESKTNPNAEKPVLRMREHNYYLSDTTSEDSNNDDDEEELYRPPAKFVQPPSPTETVADTPEPEPRQVATPPPRRALAPPPPPPPAAASIPSLTPATPTGAQPANPRKRKQRASVAEPAAKVSTAKAKRASKVPTCRPSPARPQTPIHPLPSAFSGSPSSSNSDADGESNPSFYYSNIDNAHASFASQASTTATLYSPQSITSTIHEHHQPRRPISQVWAAHDPHAQLQPPLDPVMDGWSFQHEDLDALPPVPQLYAGLVPVTAAAQLQQYHQQPMVHTLHMSNIPGAVSMPTMAYGSVNGMPWGMGWEQHQQQPQHLQTQVAPPGPHEQPGMGW